MKFILSLTIALLISNPTFATLPEISHWQQYPTISIPETVPKTETMTLSTTWKLDCGTDAEVIVGKIGAASPGINGRTLLLDSQLVQVLVIDPDGNIENTLGRPGEGPGDLPGAFRTFQLQDGRIGVSGGAPALVFRFGGMGKIVLLDPSGDPAGLWYGAGEPASMPVSSIRELRCANDHILSASQHMEMDGNDVSYVRELSVLEPTGGNRLVIARRVFVEKMEETQVHEENAYEPFAYGRCDISSNGRVAYAPVRNQWKVAIRNPNAEGMVWERPWPASPRSKSELEAAQKALGVSDQGDIFKNQPALGRLRWRPDGKLWVEVLGIDPVPGSFACFDEFSSTGQLLRRVHIEAPGDPSHDVLEIMENGRFVLLRGFKDVEENESENPVNAEVLLLEDKKL